MRKIIVFFATLVLPSLSLFAALTPSSSQPSGSRLVLGNTSANISGVVGDETDAAWKDGIAFDNAVTAVSSDLSIAKATISGDGKKVFIQPIGKGMATVTVTNSQGTYIIYYAASVFDGSGATSTLFPTGFADASAGATFDNEYIWVCDDETNILKLCSLKESGMYVKSVDINKDNCLNLEKKKKEIDMEGATISSEKYNNGKRIYWIASMGNNSSGEVKKDRNRIVATDISGEGASQTLSVFSYNSQVRSALLAWGDKYGWNFTASAAEGQTPKQIDGFNIEGLSLKEGGEVAYIGFRAPCVPAMNVTPTSANRKYAILAPCLNFEAMMNQSDGNVSPIMGIPVLFDFDGLGIRSIERTGDGRYVIVSGNYAPDLSKKPSIYIWNGDPNNGLPLTVDGKKLVKLNVDMTGLVMGTGEGHPEGLVCTLKDENTLQIHLLSDDGSVTWYDDETAAKDLTKDEWKKFRIDTYEDVILPDDMEIYTSVEERLATPFEAKAIYDLRGNKLPVAPQEGFAVVGGKTVLFTR